VDLGLPTCTSDASLYVRYTCINKKAYPTTSQSGIEESNDRKDQIILYILHLSSSPHPKHIRVMSSNQVPPLRSRNHTHTWTHSKRKIMKNEKSCRIEAHANASLKPPKKTRTGRHWKQSSHSIRPQSRSPSSNLRPQPPNQILRSNISNSLVVPSLSIASVCTTSE
jgi:hypothetical protein